MKLLRRLSLSLLVLIVAAILAELWVRRADPYGVSYYRDFDHYLNNSLVLAPFAEDGRLFRQRASHSVEFRSFRIETDPLGMRVAAATENLPVPDERMRVLFLGDSTTLGWGVDDEETWVRLLEDSARTLNGRELQCFNAGTNVYDTVQEAAALRELGPLLRPELVVVMVNTNDLDPTLEIYRALSEAGLEGSELGGLALGWAKLKHAVQSRFLGLRGLLRYWRLREFITAVERREIGLEIETNYPGQLPRLEGALLEMQEHCLKLGARLVVLDHTYPAVPDLPGFCEANGLEWVDVKWSEEEWALPIRLSRVDAHANELGNQLLMQKVVAGLSDLGILESE